MPGGSTPEGGRHMTRYHGRATSGATLGLVGAMVFAGCGGDGPSGSVAPPGGRGPTAAARLAFRTSPMDGELGIALGPIEIEILDAAGDRVSSATHAVTLTLAANPGGATLGGTTTVNARSGVATFDDLLLDRSGTGYTLEAVSANLAVAISPEFRVALTFAEVRAGATHTCAVRPDRTAYCWGARAGGKLGNGDNRAGVETRPVPVSGGRSFRSVVAGNGQTCGVSSGGPAYCWGLNASGQLGDGTRQERAVPVRVTNTGGSAVAVGGLHACVADGIAICWGGNNWGQIGDGSLVDRWEAVTVKANLSLVGVVAGFGHTCALTFDGVAYCWGYNSHGQLGDGTTINRSTPVAVSSALPFTALAAGAISAHTCGLTAGGRAWCWGKNRLGQLGDGSTSDRIAPVGVVGNIHFTSLAVGGNHTCGLTADGEVYCWGYNGFGQLGDGSRLNRTGPVLVRDGIVFAAIGAGVSHTCGVATDGVAYCWGRNRYGQLGDGTQEDRTVPTAVADP